jgi:hypothetical protein
MAVTDILFFRPAFLQQQHAQLAALDGGGRWRSVDCAIKNPMGPCRATGWPAAIQGFQRAEQEEMELQGIHFSANAPPHDMKRLGSPGTPNADP